MTHTAQPDLQKGASIVDVVISVVFIFVLTAVILYLVNPDFLLKFVKDVTLRAAFERIVQDIKEGTYSNGGKTPSCQSLAGVRPFCRNASLKNVSGCECPLFKIKDVYTGVEPYEGFKYTSKSPYDFCLSVVANDESKGKYMRYRYPEDASPKRSDLGCK